MKKLILTLVGLFFISFISASVQPSADIFISGIPEEINVGDYFDISIDGENLQNVLSYRISYLYDNDYLEVVNLFVDGSFFNSLGSPMQLSFNPKDIETTSNYDSIFSISKTLSILDNSYSGDGVFGTVRFKALKSGNTNLLSDELNNSPSWYSQLLGKGFFNSFLYTNLSLPEYEIKIIGDENETIPEDNICIPNWVLNTSEQYDEGMIIRNWFDLNYCNLTSPEPIIEYVNLTIQDNQTINQNGVGIKFEVQNEQEGKVQIKKTTQNNIKEIESKKLILILNITSDIIFDNAKISVPYDENDLNGLDESTLRFYYFNELLEEWEVLPTELDTVNNLITGLTTHFSIFGIFGEELEEPSTPIPTSPSRNSRHHSSSSSITSIIDNSEPVEKICGEWKVKCEENKLYECLGNSWIFKKDCENGCENNSCKIILEPKETKQNIFQEYKGVWIVVLILVILIIIGTIIGVKRTNKIQKVN